jgi:hypothetical protein
MKGSFFQKVFCGLLISALLLTAACSTGTIAKSTSSPTPSTEEQDPEFWRMWQNRRGVSG